MKLPPPKNGGVYVVAHRGAHQGIPENSLPAFRRAIELGCDFVEIDVRTTKDGRFVIIHNAKIDSYFPGKTGQVSEMTFSQIRELDLGEKFGPHSRGIFVPSFEEVLKLCKGKIGIYLDLKSAPVARLVKLIKEQNMEQSVLWYGTPEDLGEVKLLCKECLPMPDPYLESLLPMMLKTFHPRVLATAFDRMSPAFVEKCHSAGAIVIADESQADPVAWEKPLSWGLDGIQTDKPKELIEYLKRRKKQR